MTIYPKHPAKCDCTTPIWRYLNGQQWPVLGNSQQWVCLNCPLHTAIYVHRDDVERVRLMALIDATSPERTARV